MTHGLRVEDIVREIAFDVVRERGVMIGPLELVSVLQGTYHCTGNEARAALEDLVRRRRVRMDVDRRLMVNQERG